MAEKGEGGTLATSEENIDHLFRIAGRVVGDGLHIDLLDSLVHDSNDPDDIRRAKIEISVLLSHTDVREWLETNADRLVSDQRGKYHDAIERLPEKRRDAYREVAAMAAVPEDHPMRLPDVLEHTVSDKAETWQKHLYRDASGEYRTKLNTWETGTLKDALKDAEGWLRNAPRKQWALCVPYTLKGDTRPLYPDLLVLRQEDGPVVVDLLDPHDPGRDDAAPKAAGLATYAEHHGHLFGRIRLIAKVDGDYRHLDLKDPKTRNAVKAATTSNELKTLYTTVGAAGLT